MKKILPLLLALSLVLGGCGTAQNAPTSSGAPSAVSSEAAASSAVSLTDSNGDAFSVPAGNPRVACLYGSYAEAWLLAGGTLAGVTQDAVKERGLDVGDAKLVGTVKEPSAEEIIALEPDLVILNPDIAAQLEIKDVLESAGLSCACFRVDAFEDYRFMMEQFCNLTGREDLYEKNALDVERRIGEVLDKVPVRSFSPSFLLIRAFSSGIKAKTDDELAGAILNELGGHNIADDHPSMLEDLSLEEVIGADPDYIFVTTMGDEEKAMDYLNARIEENPAWQELAAVKGGRCVVLPKELFHYKPNDRWGESYEYLAEILYPDLFEE